MFVILIFAVVVWGLLAGLAADLSSLTMIVPAAILAQRLGCWPSAVCMPVMFPVFLYYPHATLRAGNVR